MYIYLYIYIYHISYIYHIYIIYTSYIAWWYHKFPMISPLFDRPWGPRDRSHLELWPWRTCFFTEKGGDKMWVSCEFNFLHRFYWQTKKLQYDVGPITIHILWISQEKRRLSMVVRTVWAKNEDTEPHDYDGLHVDFHLQKRFNWQTKKQLEKHLGLTVEPSKIYGHHGDIMEI